MMGCTLTGSLDLDRGIFESMKKTMGKTLKKEEKDSDITLSFTLMVE